MVNTPSPLEDKSAAESSYRSELDGIQMSQSNSSSEEEFHDTSEEFTEGKLGKEECTSKSAKGDSISTSPSGDTLEMKNIESKAATQAAENLKTEVMTHESKIDEVKSSAMSQALESKGPPEKKKEAPPSSNDVLLTQISSAIDDDEESESPDSPDSTESGVFVQAESSVNGTPTSPNFLQSPQNSLVEKICICSVATSTPVPNADTSLRLLRKFASKTSKFFAVDLGGTKTSSILNFFFGKSDDINSCTLLYKELVDILLDGDVTPGIEEEEEEPDPNEEEKEAVIESILGHTGDTMSKARRGLAIFCALVESWACDTQRSFFHNRGDQPPVGTTKLSREFITVTHSDTQQGYITGEMLGMAIDCLEALVAHGCLDGILLDIRVDSDISAQVGLDDEDTFSGTDLRQIDAVELMAEAVFLCDLSSDEVELSALKFLLTTGCRTVSTKERPPQAMLRGSHLLQSIRVCYRVYLVTDKESNKTTARAALRQIVTGTFNRLDNFTGAKAKNEKESQTK